MPFVLSIICNAFIFCLFVLANQYFSPYYVYFSSDRLLPTTSWLLRRVILLHFTYFFVWILSYMFLSLRIPFQCHCRLVAFYIQTSFHLVMKWSAIVASFVLPRYLYIYFVVPLCWFIADWTCIVARIESKVHPQPAYRSFISCSC